MEIDIIQIVTGVATNAADVLISTVTGVLPVVLPVVALFWGLNYVIKKFGLGGKARQG
jgi:hypothetical protein